MLMFSLNVYLKTQSAQAMEFGEPSGGQSEVNAEPVTYIADILVEPHPSFLNDHR